MGSTTAMAPALLECLDRLIRVPGIERFYLAGGSAVAFHLGHRRSADLDLFSLATDMDMEGLRDRALAALPGLRVRAATDFALHLEWRGTPVDLVRYPYALLEAPSEGPHGIPVAGLLDLAAMKVGAIASRGIRRDFWDLHAIILGGVPLAACLDAYTRRYGVASSDVYHVLRALNWFADAEKDPVLPAGMTEADWARIKAFFEETARALLA